MNKKTKRVLHRIALSLIVGTACLLASHSAQAQGPRRFGVSPEARSRINGSYGLALAAAADLHTGQYAQAEAEAREAMSLDALDAVGQEVLAAALYAQGKDQEALQEYQTMVVNQKDWFPRNLLPYAQLLLKSGRWEQALTVYSQALPHLPDAGFHQESPIVHDRDILRANSRFSPDVPDPQGLATALHIALGATYNGQCNWRGEPQNTEAMREYGKALQLAPDNALTNYYYGIGWQKLSPAERAEFGTAQQAKAALLKAARIGKGDVKKAAQKALRVAMNTK